MKRYTITTSAQVREAFWASCPHVTCRTTKRGRILPHNEQPAATRVAFCDWLDTMHKAGIISTRLADRVTL
jgi:hypothetical protein